MRVALLHPFSWPEVRRGAERFTRELAAGLIARGHEPRLITSHAARRARAVEDGLPVLRLRRPPQGVLRRWNVEDPVSHVPGAWLALRRGDDDVAHALDPADALAATRSGRPAVFSYMGIPVESWLRKRRWRYELLRAAVARSDASVALSAAAAARFRAILGADVRVIPPGVDVEAFAPEPAARAPEPTIVCAAAVAEPRKRVGLLLEAFATVRRERPGARLVLNRPRDAALAAALAAHDGVDVVDLDDRPALAAAYRRAWVSALPSVGEAFGLVLAEALACGTPVVASDDGGMPEVLGGDDGVGRLFAGDDPAPLARALLDALDLAGDPATPAACRARAERFSTAACADAYVALYRELTG